MQPDIYRNLGLRVKEYRNKIGWSQEELGEHAGLHASFIGQIERNVKKVSLLSVQRLAAAFKVKISDLLDEKPVTYTATGWEKKMAAVIRDKPPQQQEYVYKLTRKLTRLISKK
ncbi:MAG: helix-turn-helix transcriptional regulator [Elusimicrobia bacterium]|nr:helix-turn-helix transcriptional regulator [Elusimicrobiota bacterium]